MYQLYFYKGSGFDSGPFYIQRGREGEMGATLFFYKGSELDSEGMNESTLFFYKGSGLDSESFYIQRGKEGELAGGRAKLDVTSVNHAWFPQDDERDRRRQTDRLGGREGERSSKETDHSLLKKQAGTTLWS